MSSTAANSPTFGADRSRGISFGPNLAHPDLASIGMNFASWQAAAEVAINSGALEVIGEVCGGQLVQFADSSGAQLMILAVEPFATFAGFAGTATAFGHVSMLNDVLALVDVVTDSGAAISSVTCNLTQGPLLVDEPVQEWEQVAFTALGLDVTVYPNSAEFRAAGGAAVGLLVSTGAAIVQAGDGSKLPDASATLVAEVAGASYRFNALTNQRFIHLNVLAPFPLEVCLPDGPQLPAAGSILAGKVLLTGSIKPPQGCGDGCGDGGCGCGSGGCGSH